MSKELKYFDALSNSAKWIFAKTYADFAPHEYTLRKFFTKDHFDFMVNVIRSFGVHARYGNFKPQIYLIRDEYYYWTMGAPIEETIVINRAPLSENELINGVWHRKTK